MFMILSGFFLHRSINNYSFTTLVVNRASMILIPAIFWNIISWATTPDFHIDRLWTGLYFLWAVFMSSLICAVGNVISPVVSAIIIIVLLKVIEYMQKSKLVKWMIGMKVIG